MTTLKKKGCTAWCSRHCIYKKGDVREKIRATLCQCKCHSEGEKNEECEKYGHVPVPYDVAFWHCQNCDAELFFVTREELAKTEKQKPPMTDGFGPKTNAIDTLPQDDWRGILESTFAHYSSYSVKEFGFKETVEDIFQKAVDAAEIRGAAHEMKSAEADLKGAFDDGRQSALQDVMKEITRMKMPEYLHRHKGTAGEIFNSTIDTIIAVVKKMLDKQA